MKQPQRNCPYVLRVCLLLTTLLSFVYCNKNGTPYKSVSFYSEALFNVNNKAASNRIKKITTNPDTHKELFKVVHISDSHISSWSDGNYPEFPHNLLESVFFANQTELSINAILSTGDNISNSVETTKSEAIHYHESFIEALFLKNKIPTAFCMGNHDSNIFEKADSASFLSKSELHKLYFSANIQGMHVQTDENYYYKDIPNPAGGFIRVIALDCTDQETFKYNALQVSLISQKQADWLCEVALKKDMSPQHHVIVLCHYPLDKYSSDKRTFMNSGSFQYGYKVVPEIIEAFRKKETFQHTYNSTLDNDTLTVSADFRTASGEFVCYLGGHVHTTGLFEIKDLCNQSSTLKKQLMLLVSTQVPALENSSYSQLNRMANTKNSNNFNIYAIDTEAGIIHSTYFGANPPSYHTNRADFEKIRYR